MSVSHLPCLVYLLLHIFVALLSHSSFATLCFFGLLLMSVIRGLSDASSLYWMPSVFTKDKMFDF
jgi:hypothetical protein